MERNNNKNNNKNSRRNRKRNNGRRLNKQFNKLAINPVPRIRLSMLGKTLTRQLDAIVPVYAVNSLGGAYYSFSTSTGGPVMSANISTLFLTSYPEYSQLVRTYGLFQTKSIDLEITRSSSLIQNFNVIGNTPPYYLQLSMTNYTSGSTSAQQGLACADNNIEVNLQTYDACSATCIIPPAVAGRSSAVNDIFTFGSNVWIPTIINGANYIPDFYLNLGSFTFPSFQTGAANTAYLIGNVHCVLSLVFAGTQSM